MTRARPIPRTPSVALAILLLASSLLVSCAGRGPTPRVVDGVAFGTTRAPFRGRWWQYYERGVSWSLGGFWKEAEADLRACLQQRQTDARRARTYGMHFVQCFVHRELGAVLLEQGQLDEAEREVLASLAQEPSAKGEFLLERIRAVRAGAPPPATAGTSSGHIALDSITAAPEADAAGSLSVSGSVPAGAELQAVAADGSARPVNVAAEGRFTAVLNAGERLRTGRGASTVMVVPMPPAAPALTIDGPDDGRIVTEAQALYRYEASADAGLTAISVARGDGTTQVFTLG